MYCKCNKGSCKNLHLPQFLPTNPCKFRGLYQQISAGQTCNLQPSTVCFSRYPLSANISSPWLTPNAGIRSTHTPRAESVFTSSKTSLKTRSSPLFRRQWKRAAWQHRRHGSIELVYPFIRWLNPQKGSKRLQCYYMYWVITILHIYIIKETFQQTSNDCVYLSYTSYKYTNSHST